MRELTGHKVNGCNEQLSIFVTDEPGAGGANHSYLVMLPRHREMFEADLSHDSHATPVANCGSIRFQSGPIDETGVNGLTHEVLLAILIDRLQSFQNGPYKCRENAIALTHLEDAQHWLQHRTRARLARGVEGTHTV